MSATLRPFDVTADVLGLDDVETMAYGAQFPEERRRTYAVSGPALFASERDDPATQDTIGGALADAARMTPETRSRSSRATPRPNATTNASTWTGRPTSTAPASRPTTFGSRSSRTMTRYCSPRCGARWARA